MRELRELCCCCVNTCVLAADGSHIPFHPMDHKNEYRNYKGWHSIMAVAFVDSYYRFFDLDVGAPGRSGDLLLSLRHIVLGILGSVLGPKTGRARIIMLLTGQVTIPSWLATGSCGRSRPTKRSISGKQA